MELPKNDPVTTLGNLGGVGRIHFLDGSGLILEFAFSKSKVLGSSRAQEVCRVSAPSSRAELDYADSVGSG